VYASGYWLLFTVTVRKTTRYELFQRERQIAQSAANIQSFYHEEDVRFFKVSQESLFEEAKKAAHDTAGRRYD